MAVKTQSEKSKIKRARSWAKNQEAKKDRVAEQEANHKRNVELGSTARERYHAASRTAKLLDSALANSAAGNVSDLGDFTQYADDEFVPRTGQPVYLTNPNGGFVDL